MKTHQADYTLIFVVLILVVFGLVVLSSASAVMSNEIFNQSNYFLKHQIFYGLSFGIVGFFLCQKIHYRFWQKAAFPLIIFCLALLVLVFVPGIGYGSGEARRWIQFGFLSLQPFEFVKLSFILYLSALLSRKGDSQKVIKESLIPFFVVTSIISLMLILQPNMSALIITFLISGLLYFLVGLKISHLLAMGVLALIGIFALIKTAPYRMNRLNIFLHPEIDPQGIGYQINQALLAIGSGGLFGLGLGHSIQKWKYLPEVIGDSIFAIVAEELGLIGAGILVFLFVAFAWRGFKIAKNAPNKFSFLVAAGITGWLFFQAFINIAAISGIIPLTGLPLPFISYGGSSLVAALLGVGILVNISKYT